MLSVVSAWVVRIWPMLRGRAPGARKNRPPRWTVRTHAGVAARA